MDNLAYNDRPLSMPVHAVLSTDRIIIEVAAEQPPRTSCYPADIGSHRHHIGMSAIAISLTAQHGLSLVRTNVVTGALVEQHPCRNSCRI